MYEEYPKYLYDGLEGILVENAEEEEALGEGYTAFPVETPDKPRRGRPPKAR